MKYLVSLIAILFLLTASQPTSAKEQIQKPIQVAILIFDGVELLDFTGPAEVFIVADHGNAFKVSTVSGTTGLVTTMGGIQVKPDATYANAPAADIVIVPGGAMSNVHSEGIEWLKKSSKQARITMSVCMGAFLLAKADLLDGIQATTHRWGLQGLQSAAPTCKVVRTQRFVDAGKIVTTGGVTAGIDGALHVVERLLGKEAAEWTSTEWMEYKRLGAENLSDKKSSG